jgi:Flp pilus assembly protein TadG
VVAVFVLFVVGAMAALSIDVTTIYTARSEAQLVADSAALAGARVLANSGATSDPNSATDGLMAATQTLAVKVAKHVAKQNKIGGNPVLDPNLTPAPSFGGSWFNPTITVNVKVTNLPTFFARVWGRTTLAVVASATAEAYNPSGANTGVLGQTATPVAPLCVKPWLLPNMDPSNSGKPIFDPTTGAITTTSNLLGWSSIQSGVPMSLSCPDGNCSTLLPPYGLAILSR